MSKYPEFHGTNGEDVVEFLEDMELACISHHVVDEGHVLRLLKIFLKGDARTWLRELEARDAVAVPPLVMTLDRFKENLLERFQEVEDVNVVWQALSKLKQDLGQSVDDYVQVFTGFWDRWIRTLREEAPPMFVKKSLFLDGLLPDLKVRVELENPKVYEDAVRIAKKKEAKMLKQREMGMYPQEDMVSARGMHVNMVEIEKKLMRDVMEEKPQRPMQIKRGFYYMPADYFSSILKQEKVDAKQVEMKSEDACLKHDMDVEKKDMHVEQHDEGSGLQEGSVAGEELPVAPSLDVDVMGVHDIDAGSSNENYLSMDVHSMHDHECRDLDDALASFADDERENGSDLECFSDDSLHDSSREEDGVETNDKEETSCDMGMKIEEDDLIIEDFFEQVDNDVVPIVIEEEVEVLNALKNMDVVYDDTRGVGKAQVIVCAKVMHKERCDVKVMIENGEQEPKMDANVPRTMDVVEAVIEKSVDVNRQVMKLWSAHALLNGMIVVVLSRVLKTKMFMIGELFYYGICQEKVLDVEGVRAEIVEVYQTLDDDDLMEHMFIIWYAMKQGLFVKDSKEWDGVATQFPFDPGG